MTATDTFGLILTGSLFVAFVALVLWNIFGDYDG